MIGQVCDSNDIQIIKGRVSQDQVHLYISYPPQLAVSEIVRRIKGRSSRKIQEEFLQLHKRYWGKHFWEIGYAAFSTGQVSDEMVQEYLEKPDQHPNHSEMTLS